MVINSIEIEVERKPIKNLHLAVYPPDGRVHVSAPQTYTDEQIKFFEDDNTSEIIDIIMRLLN